jgi:hypothetical protein
MDVVEREGAFLVALAQHGIRPDMQEVLIRGNPDLGIPPGALRAAMAPLISENDRLRQDLNTAIERAAKVAEDVVNKAAEDQGEILLGNRIASSIRSLKTESSNG